MTALGCLTTRLGTVHLPPVPDAEPLRVPKSLVPGIGTSYCTSKGGRVTFTYGARDTTRRHVYHQQLWTRRQTSSQIKQTHSSRNAMPLAMHLHLSTEFVTSPATSSKIVQTSISPQGVPEHPGYVIFDATYFSCFVSVG
jgi:hypothetical protein